MSDLSHLHVLVLEDDAFQREVLAAALRRLGIRSIVCVADGRAGLHALERQPHGFDIVLCDLEMDGMDGIEFVQRVSKSAIGGLIFCSSHGDAVLASAEWMARACRLPLIGVLPKPVSTERLRALLARDLPAASVTTILLPTDEGDDPALAEDLREALDTGQFVPFYQPKVDMRTRRCVGAEILVRWIHPERGVASPVQFIEAIERHDLMEGLTYCLLGEAAADQRRWIAEGRTIPLALNVPPSLLDRRGFAGRLLDRLQQAGGSPDNLTVEITEQALSRDETALTENAIRLRMRGCGISIDDFGTGYSSLQQVERVPLTELKIDRSFVRHLPSATKDRSIVESTVALAQKLGVRLVAEGIETEEQHRCLLDLGCETAQGYLYARPMPADRLSDWLALDRIAA